MVRHRGGVADVQLALEVLEHGQGMFVLDPEYRFTLLNDEFERFASTSRQDLLGRVFWEVYPEAAHPESNFWREYRRAMQERVVVRFEELYRPQGIWYSISAYPVARGGIAVFFRDVTAEKQEQDRLRRSEERARARAAELQAVLDTVAAAVFITRDPGARVMEANRFFTEGLQLPPGANVSKSAPEGERPTGFRVMRDGVEVPPEELPVQVAARSGLDVRGYEFDLVYADGQVRHMFGHATPLRDEVGRATGAVGAFLDVTEQNRVIAALRDTEARLRAVVRATSDAVFGASADWSELWPLHRREHLPAEKERTRNWRDVAVHPDDRALVDAAIAEAIRTKGIFSVEHRVLRPDGSVGWTSSRAVPMLGARGEIVEWVGAATDITSRKLTEEALRRSEEEARNRAQELETLLDTVPAAVWIARDARGDRIDANRFGTELLRGRSGDNVSVTAPGADRPRHFTVERGGVPLGPEQLPVQRAALLGQEVRDAEIDLRFHDGELRHLLGNASPLRDEHGTVVGSIGAFMDVTSRRKAEEALGESTALLQALSDTVPEPLFAKDEGGRMIFANPATLRAIGKPSEEVLGRSEAEWLDDPAQAEAIHANDMEVMASGQARVVEEAMVTPEGTRIFLGTKAPLRDPTGRVVGLVGLSRDITRRKRMEQELRDADQRKNEFLAVLSHELRNPLAPIRNSILILERLPFDSAPARRAREVIRRQSEHLTRLVEDLLDVTRISRGKIQLQRQVADLVQVLRRTVEDHAAGLEGAELALELDLPAAPVWADVDPTRIAQVVGNLLTNAAKFTPPHGRVTVRLRTRLGRATIEVHDTGIGIGPEQLSRMFEPFAQESRGLTRSRGGLGLGLALSKGLVEAHGGAIAAHSAGPGRGSVFTIELPLAEGPAARRDAIGPPPRASDGSAKRILLIDDNEDAARTLSDLLESLGHQVAIALDGTTGIARARELRPDVVICDLGLPDVSGYDVARTLRADAALRSTRLVALSGYGYPEDKQRAREAGFEAHFTRPTPLDDLAAVLR